MNDSTPHSAVASPAPTQRSALLVLAFFLILLLGGYLRFAAVLQTNVPNHLQSDAKDYFSYAYNLIHYGVYSRAVPPAEAGDTYLPEPDAIRSPGYPLLLSLFVDGKPTAGMITSILLTQAVLGTLTLLLAHGIYRRFLPEVWALAASLLTALSPHLVIINIYILSESLFTFLCVLTAVLALWHLDSPRWSRALSVGAVIGLATLTRPTLQYFLVPFAVLLAVHSSGRERIRQPFWVLTGFLLVLSPWWIRNLISLGTFSDPTLMLNGLVHGIYPDFMYNDIERSLGSPYRSDPRLAEFSGSTSAFLGELYSRFKETPGRYLYWYLIGKPLALFSWLSEIAYARLPGGSIGKLFIYPVIQSPYSYNPVFLFSRALMYYSHWIWVTLCLIASVLAWLPAIGKRLSREGRFTARLLAMLILYFIAVHVAGYPLGRYSIPLRPFLYGLAVLLLYHAWQVANPWLGSKLRQRQGDPAIRHE